MPGEIRIGIGTVLAFLLVLARVAGAFIFIPAGWNRHAPALVRVGLAVILTVALMPFWPKLPDTEPSLGWLVAAVAAEAAFGLACGVAIGFLQQGLAIAAQIIGLQAGYSYAVTVDPNSEADSGVLLVVAELLAGLLFFAAGLDRELLRVFANSLTVVPPGQSVAHGLDLNGILRLGSAMFITGLRLALPVIAALLMVDLTLALITRLNAQLQLLTLAFPAKMLAGLVLLASVLGTAPLLYHRDAARVIEQIQPRP